MSDEEVELRNPKELRKCRFWTIRCYFVLLSLIVLCQSMITSGYLSSILSSLEQYYGYSLEHLGLALSSYDIIGILSIPCFSFLGSKSNRARLVAFGALIFAVGNVVFLLPYFIYGYPSDILSNSSNSTSDYFCHDNSSFLNSNEISSVYPPSWCYYLIILAMLIMSVGASPFYTLGITYLTDHLDKDDQPIYTSILYGMVALGPCLGFLMGSFFVSQWINIHGGETNHWNEMNKNDPRWIGRWWGGFLISTFFLTLFAVLLSTFPSHLHSNCSSSLPVQSSADSPNPSVRLSNLKVLLRNVIDLFGNITYRLIVLINAIEGILVVSFTTYLVKYIQSVFHLSPSLSSICTGLILLPSAILGTLTGGYLIRRLHLNVFGSIKLIFICSTISLISLITLIFVKCSSNIHYSFDTSCSQMCHCSSRFYQPVCFDNQVNYLSPCYAGCTSENGSVSLHCQCLSDGDEVQLGVCNNGCQVSLIMFLVILFVLIYFEMSMATPQLMIVLRSIDEQFQSLGLGLENCLLKLFAQIPTPIFFGYLIDRQCLYWSQSIFNERTSCFIYNQNRLPLILFGTMILIKIISLFLITILYFIHRRTSTSSEREHLLNNTISSTS